MAHERLSPRQKMIGMMYLVLTAMLALNVSKDSVKAFMRVEQSLKTTVMNYVAKNNDIYAMFDEKYALNPAKYKGLKEEANTIKQRSDELFDYMQGLKVEIINTAEGEVNEAVKGTEIFIDKVLKFDENNIPSEIMIGSEENGKAFDLKNQMDLYRDEMLKIVTGKNPSLTVAASLKSVFNTEDVMDLTGTKKENWEVANFYHLPLVAVIAILTKLQVDVRNAETDILNYLYEQVEARTVRFNRLEGTVISNSTYVMQGGEYEAQVFLTASDSTSDPEIKVGNYKTTTSGDGSESYEMVGNFTTLPIDENGRGIYKVRATPPLGARPWGGLISITAADGSVIVRPFKASYAVGEVNVTVSPTAMNVLYEGIPNPLNISVPGVGNDKLRVQMRNGNVVPGKLKNYKGETWAGDWAATPTTGVATAEILVSEDKGGGKLTPYPTTIFRVRPIPNPIAKFADKSDGKVDKNVAMMQLGVIAVLENFDFDLRFFVTEFSLNYNDKGNDFQKLSKGAELTQEMKDAINRFPRGRRFSFQDIKAKGPDGKVRPLPPITLSIE